MSTATSRRRTCIGRELSHIQRYPVRGAPDGSAARNSRERAAPSGGDREAAAGHCESIPRERTRQRSLTLRNVRAPEHRSDAHPLGTTRTTLPRALAAPAFGSRAGATSARPPSLEFCPSHEDDVVPREAGYHLARRRMARGRSDACRLGRRWGYGDERQGVGPAVPSRSVVLLSRSCRVRRSRRARIT
jgi:hypothetical protein